MSPPAAPGFRSNYSRLDRLLHRLALQVAPVAEMSFDLDQALRPKDDGRPEVARQRHVFVSGLARAGTTVLMRRFHETGAFRSLTYRDMPFVLAPNLWRRLSTPSRREAVAAQRAHGDRLEVDFDSPESLDEVFWRIFCGDDYIRDDRLVPHTPDEESIAKFRRYVAAILSAERPEIRYLSKNNNNVLRLAGIREAFPEALVLVPFRDPVRQAASLLDQHRRFRELQRADPFVLSYMSWLGHHEFGGDHRPFRFRDGDLDSLARRSPDTLDYWVANWIDTYGWLVETAPEAVVFVCYEDLCEDGRVWNALCDLAGLDRPAAAAPFRMAERPVPSACAAELEKAARHIYDRLRDRSLGRTPLRYRRPGFSAA